MPRGDVGLKKRVVALESVMENLVPRVDTLFQQNENLLTNPWSPLGSWVASTNSPPLANADAAVAGASYLAADGGTVDFGAGGGGIVFLGGDLVSKNAAGIWFKSAGIGSVIAGFATLALARAELDVMTIGDVNDRQLSKAPSNGLYFDGVDDSAATATGLIASSKLSFNTSGLTDLPFSGSAIIRVDDVAGQFQIAGKESGLAQYEWSWRVNASGFILLVFRDVSAAVYVIGTASTGALVEGQFVHVAFTYDGVGGASAASNIKIYVNGSLQTSSGTYNASYEAMEDGTAGVTFGKYVTGALFGEGVIESCIIFNRELTAAEILRLSNNNVPEVADQYAGAVDLTSGTLVIGSRYRLTNWITADDFTDVGAASNADGEEFVASGDTPATWSNSSVVTRIGAVLSLSPGNIEVDGDWIDASSNRLNGTNTGASPLLTHQRLDLADANAAAGEQVLSVGTGFSVKKSGYVNATRITIPTSELTVATAAVTATGSRHTIDTEGDASADDLATINGGEDGMILVLTAENDARTVTVQDSVGNIDCAGDMVLDAVEDSIELMYLSSISKWVEKSRSANAT